MDKCVPLRICTDDLLPDMDKYATIGGSYDLVVAVDGNDETADGSEALPFATLQGAVNEVARRSTTVMSDIHIRLKAGIYRNTEVKIEGISGGTVYIETFSGNRDVSLFNANSPSKYSPVIDVKAPARFWIKNLTLGGESSSSRAHTAVTLMDAGFSRMENCIIQHCYNAGHMGFPLPSLYVCGANLYIYDCKFNDVEYAIGSQNGAAVSSYGNTATNTKYGLYVHNGFIFKMHNSAQPSGSVANERKENGGQIWG